MLLAYDRDLSLAIGGQTRSGRSEKPECPNFGRKLGDKGKMSYKSILSYIEFNVMLS